ncbi:hypothetical protein MP638_002290 [Amoeboaphelidium occidentale]|nr:hypothetical protein MP638_002290 [Amoeboaphelidium occidentale]
MYKPRLKLADRPDDHPERTVTTFTGLKGVLKIPAFKDVILDAVARCTDIQFEASRLMNGFVIWLCERNIPVLDLRYSSGMMMQFYYAVCSVNASRSPLVRKTVSNAHLEQYLNEVYTPCRPPQLPWSDSSYLSQLILNLARLHSTNSQNHIVMNIFKVIKHWLCFKLSKRLSEILTSDEIQDVADYIIKELTRVFGDDEIFFIPFSIIDRVTAE